jgi:hypothetical protein
MFEVCLHDVGFFFGSINVNSSAMFSFCSNSYFFVGERIKNQLTQYTFFLHMDINFFFFLYFKIQNDNCESGISPIKKTRKRGKCVGMKKQEGGR